MIQNRSDMDLQNSVREGDLKLVKYYLSRIDYLNSHSIKEQLGLLLHETFSAEVATELLKHGAEVDERNSMRETPLHSAISIGKNFTFVKQLLVYGASVYASNYKGSTPLYLEVKKESPNLEVVKLLLEYGADINMQNQERRQFCSHCSALDVSVRNLECAKLLVKYCLLQNYYDDIHNIVNLDPYKTHPNYAMLSSYLHECVSELDEMKHDMLCSQLSFYEFLTTDTIVHIMNVSNTNKWDILENIFSKLIDNRYVLYQDVIIEKLGRQNLLHKVNNLPIFTDFFKADFKKRIILDNYSTPYVTKYLSNFDILNLIKAFDN